MTATARRLSEAVLFAAENPIPSLIAGERQLHATARPIVTTGYYGRFDADGRIRVTKVHARLAGERRPLCGHAVHPDHQWHWCSNSATTNYIDCGSCTNLLAEVAAALPGRVVTHL